MDDLNLRAICLSLPCIHVLSASVEVRTDEQRVLIDACIHAVRSVNAFFIAHIKRVRTANLRRTGTSARKQRLSPCATMMIHLAFQTS